MKLKLGSFLAAMLLVVVGGYVWQQQAPRENERTVVLTVTFSALPKAMDQVVITYEASHLRRTTAKPHASPWSQKVNLPVGDFVRLDASRDTPGNLSCLIQILPNNSFADTDSRDSMGGVTCRAIVK